MLLNELQHYQLFCSECYLQTRPADLKENHMPAISDIKRAILNLNSKPNKEEKQKKKNTHTQFTVQTAL